MVEIWAVLSICAFVFSLISMGLSIWNTIGIQAQKNSTHTVIPVPTQGSEMEKIEKELEKLAKGAGGDQSDLNMNLFNNGLDPDELV